jgi:hypothetical protein
VPPDPFADLVDRARADEARRTRSRQRWLRQQAEEDAGLVGTLVDLAEAGLAVTVQTTSGRTHHGVLAAVATDFVVLGGVVVPTAAIALLRAAATPTGDRPPPVELGLRELLAGASGHRPRVRVGVAGTDQPLVGELRAVGVDVVTIALDGERRHLCLVPLQSLTELALTSG